MAAQIESRVGIESQLTARGDHARLGFDRQRHFTRIRSQLLE